VSTTAEFEAELARRRAAAPPANSIAAFEAELKRREDEEVGGFKRVVVGGLRDAAEAFLQGTLGSGSIGGRLISKGADLAGLPSELPETVFPEVPEPEGTLGQLGRGGIQFMTGFVPGLGIAKAFKVGTYVAKALAKFPKLATFAGAAAEGEVAAQLAEQAVFDPSDPQFSNFINEIGMGNVVTEFLATNETDPEALNRFRRSAEGLGLGLLATPFVEAVVRGGRGLIGGIRGPQEQVIEKALEVVPAISDLAYSMFPIPRGRVSSPPPVQPTAPRKLSPSADSEPFPVDPRMLETTRPSAELKAAVQDAALEAFKKGGVPRRDPGVRISDTIFELLDAGRINTPELEEIFNRHDVTMGDFAKVYKIDTNLAAKELASWSRMKKLTGDIDGLVKQAEGEDGRLASAIKSEPIDERGILTRMDDITRGAMVSTLGTAMRNLGVGFLRVPFDVLERTLEYGLQKVLRRTNWLPPNLENPIQTPLDILGNILRFAKPRESRAITKRLLEVKPKMYDEIMRRYSADLAVSRVTGKGVVDRILGGAEKGVSVLNVFNRAQDQIFRAAVFTDSIARGLRAVDLDLDSIMKSGRTSDIPEDILERGVRDALEFTFSGEPRSAAGKEFVGLWNKLRPVSTVFLPFPRFMVNAFRFMTEFSPLGPFALFGKTEWAGFKGGDTRLLTRGLVGSAALYAGYAIRASDAAGERWYELKNPLGEGMLDMRAYYPIVAYLFVGDVIKRTLDGTLFNMRAEEILEGVSGIQVRGGADTGFRAVDQFLNDLSGDFTNQEKGLKIVKRAIGAYLSRALVPFQQLRDLYSYIDPDTNIIRDTSEAPFLGPLLRSVPGAGQDLPPVESPTREADITREGEKWYQHPILRQLTGITVRSPKNPVEKELDRLDFEYSEIVRSTGDPAVNRLIRKYQGPATEMLASRFVESVMYKSIKGDATKRWALKMVISLARSWAVTQAVEENPRAFDAVNFKSAFSVDERRALREYFGDVIMKDIFKKLQDDP
jgi:hypothetical protein